MQIEQEDWISGALRQGTSCEINLVRSRIKHATVAATVVFCMYRSSRELENSVWTEQLVSHELQEYYLGRD